MKIPKKNKYIEYQQNPTLFIKECIDSGKLWEKQIEIIESVRDNRNTYVKACHGVGKTYIASRTALWFLYCFYPATVLTTAPSWPQVEKLLWAEINYAHANAKLPLGGKTTKSQLFIDDNWFALGISPRIDTEDDGKRLTGFHNKNLLVIFDEAPACNPKLWDIKETLMTSKNVKFLAIGNPVVNSGHFYNGFTNEEINSINMSIFDSPNFKANNIKATQDLQDLADTPYKERNIIFDKMTIPFPDLTTPRWATERLIDWGVNSPLFESRVIGKFPRKTEDTIISLTDLEECVNVVPTGKHPKTLGVDVARFGSDDTVLIGYHDYKQCYKDVFNGQDLVKTANLIKHKILYEGYKTVVIDDTGMGGGVTDMVHSFLSETVMDGISIIPVNFAQASSIPEYDGIVTEMYYNVKGMVEDKIINVVDDGKLFSELTNRKYKFTPKGKIKIESKDDYKKRTGLKSPDEGDAFILCCYGFRATGDFEFDSGDDRMTAEMYE